MRLKRAEWLAVAVSLVGSAAVVAALAVGLVTSRESELVQAEQRLQQFASMLSEHTARSFGGIDVLLRELTRDLSQLRGDWRQWQDARGWEYVAERHSRSLPQLRNIAVFDETGRQRFTSTVYPTPVFNVGDRSYFQALKAGAEVASFGPFISRNTHRYAYGVGRRIGSPGAFEGVAFGTMELSYFQEFCWPIRLHDEFDALLVNERGEVVSSCRPIDLSVRSPTVGKAAAAALGIPAVDTEPGRYRKHDMLFAVVALPAYPELRIVAALPESAALNAWRQRFAAFAAFAFVIVAILLSGGALVRRQIKQLSAASAELSLSREDLEERVHRATGELAQQKEEAERANLAKSRFLAAASHDLRQPLHALSLFAADLQRQVTSGYTRDLDQLAAQINSSVTSLAEMLDMLLDISRLDLGGIEPDIHPFPVQAVFDRLHLAFRRNALGRRITLRIRPSDLVVVSDIHLTERMLANLVSNAIRYTPEGGRVLVAARRRGAKVRIEVRDNGVGIAPEHQGMIFKEFFQVGNAARDQKMGLGLGLSIVQRLIRTLKADLTLSSQQGVGTSFAVELPAGEQLERRVEDGAAATVPLLFIGQGDELDRIAAFAADWGYECRQPDKLRGIGSGFADAILVVAAAELERVRPRLGADSRVVVIGEAEPAENIHVVRPPIKPARLRALLQRLQKTLSKSM